MGHSALEFQDVVNAGLTGAIEAAVAAGVAPQSARKWWTGEIAHIANEREAQPTDAITRADLLGGRTR